MPPRTRRSPRWESRAAEAERSVTTLFGGRLFGMPFTHLARTVHPAGGGGSPWHYWWQAHYLDAIVDAGLRCLRGGDPAGARDRARTADRLLRTIRLRNRARWVNDYYDDMAWLVLAAGRLALLHAALGRPRPRRGLRTAERDLTRQLRSALTSELGGGLFWNVERDFKNVPASAPAALHLARLGRTEEARGIVDWLYARLWSAESGLFLDGVRLTASGTPAGRRHARAAHRGASCPTSGPTTRARCSEPSSPSVTRRACERAADLVAAVSDRLTTEADGIRLLRTHGGGDGGLFTGILGRYLALAATTEGLVRQCARHRGGTRHVDGATRSGADETSAAAT